MHNIAIAAESDFTPGGAYGPWYDDEKLQQALAARGNRVSIINWEDTDIDMLRFDAIFVTTTWNGCDDPQKFMNWLDRCETDGRKRLINSREVIDDGFIKYRYLSFLLDHFGDCPGHRSTGYITPSAFFIYGDAPHKRVKPLDNQMLVDILVELDDTPQWSGSEIVIKPVISADGKDTYVYNRTGSIIIIDTEKKSRFVLTDIGGAEIIFSRIAGNRDRGGTILQPYMRGIEQGEFSLTFFEREFSHAIQKPPLFKGDGAARRIALGATDLPVALMAFAQDVIDYMIDHYEDDTLIRSRIDIIDQDGTPVLCEFECVDPNTNIKTIEDQLGAAAADAIVQTYADVIQAAAELLAEQSGAPIV